MPVEENLMAGVAPAGPTSAGTATFIETGLQLSTGAVPVWSGGTGRPVLYLHSAAGLHLGRALTAMAESFRIVAPVFPGFDGTPLHEGVASMMALADLAAEVIASEGDEPWDVIGHSFGGWVAAWLAVRHPGRVDQLVLEAPGGFRPEGIGGLGQDPAALTLGMYAHPERAEMDAKDRATRAANRQVIDHYHGPEATDDALVARLSAVRCLTLIVAGNRDGITPPQSGQLLKRTIPRSYLTYVYDAAHMIEVDQPERFVRVVRDFLTRGEAFIIHWKDGAESTRSEPQPQ
jgi:pimeloyl-ACP methyl ester carboxylesterase